MWNFRWVPGTVSQNVLSLLFWGLGKIAASFDSICSTTSMQTWTVFILQLWQTPMSLLMAVLSEQFRVCWKGFFSSLFLQRQNTLHGFLAHVLHHLADKPVPEIRCYSHFEADSQLNTLWFPAQWLVKTLNLWFWKVFLLGSPGHQSKSPPSLHFFIRLGDLNWNALYTPTPRTKRNCEKEPEHASKNDNSEKDLRINSFLSSVPAVFGV